jgi:dolichol-phosphate mannosyltransferase
MIAVVVPCYRVRARILEVLAAIGSECERIYVVDDCCPEGSGAWVEAQCNDARVRVLKHDVNLGVGGATLTGYAAAVEDGATVIVKIDGDGQMDPRLVPLFVAPILAGEADYTKGNRFFEPSGLHAMPRMRLLGNTALSFLSKLSSGYWNLFDPTNGYTAIHAKVARLILRRDVDQRWFFESDVLHHLGILRAVICDVPMAAHYGDERSSLRIASVLGVFAWKHARNVVRRVFYNYYLRDFNIASIELALGPVLLAFGSIVGAHHWLRSIETGELASAGTVMLAALPIILGTQLVLAFLGFDLRNIPAQPIHRRLR